VIFFSIESKIEVQGSYLRSDKVKRNTEKKIGMKRQIFKLSLLTVLGATLIVSASLIAGCSTGRPVVVTPSGAVVVPEAPPPPKHEAVGAPPNASQVWVEGYWSYQDGRWAWISGHWETRPTATAAWVPGHWDHTNVGWVWRPGYWQ
jgi:hypothetical protein